MTHAVAIIGMSCRLPQAPDPQAFWRLLERGDSAITEAPADRFGEEAAARAGGRGGFLDQVDAFDAGFFGISPREAVVTDPQQRLMLELAWEALEDAGGCTHHARRKQHGRLRRRHLGRLRRPPATLGLPR